MKEDLGQTIAANASMKKMPVAHRGWNVDTVSSLLGISVAAAMAAFLWGAPGWAPKDNGHIYSFVAPWFSIAYIAPQILLLLESIRKAQYLSLLDLVSSSLPIFVGALALINEMQGHLPLSGAQVNMVAVITVTAVVDVVMNIYVKFALQGRNITAAS